MKQLLFFIATVLFALPAFAQSADLEKAYQREVGYLKSQERALNKRIKSVEADGQKKISSIKGTVSSLQNRWLALQADSELLQKTLSDMNANGPTSEDQNEAVLGTYDQGRQSLNSLGFSVVERERVSPDDLSALFAIGVEAIEKGRVTSTETGTYFNTDGVSKSGEITRVGRIAAFANGIPLAPAGEGRLKEWPAQSGSLPAVVLFESIEKPLAPPEDKTVLDTLEAGGTIAYVIVVLGFLALLLIFGRFGLLFRFNTPASFVASIEHAIAKSRDEAMKLAESSGGLAATAVAKLLRKDAPTIEDIDEIVAGLAPKAERFNTIIMVIAAIAPLLGLLGTVTGMIATFDIITEFGTGDPKLLSSGISEALITTKLGLMVAIPALVMGNVLRAWGDRIIGDIDHACLVARGSGEPSPTGSQEEVARAVVLSQIGGTSRLEEAMS